MKSYLARFIALMFAALTMTGCGSAASAPSATMVPRPAATVVPSPQPGQATATQSAPTESSTAPVPTRAPGTPVSSVDLATVQLAIAPVAEGFERPTHVTHAGDDSGRLFVVEQAGVIWVLRDGQRLQAPLLDIRSIVGSEGNEQGLLSVAFHPDFAANGRFFVNYTDRGGSTVVAEYAATGDSADPQSARVLLTIPQPAANHNGGLLKFGPDGMLYIGMGDGGRAGDPWGNGQNPQELLGKLLRIDVDGGEPYAVPADNPFVQQQNGRVEIWAWGLRNPWRFSFDRLTGDLYIADVGQNAFEEVHFQAAGAGGGANYGWNTFEGNSCFSGSNCNAEGFVAPVAVYAHSEGGCSITGGYVYRGTAFPNLNGLYIYSDYCTGNVWALRGDATGWQNRLVTRFSINPSSFGEDEAGELYVVDGEGGVVYRVVEG
jgi:glucose/arabinose dehydrogenase